MDDIIDALADAFDPVVDWAADHPLLFGLTASWTLVIVVLLVWWLA